MRVVVFAHRPPPHHGQSIMVEHLLSVLRDLKPEVETVHINAVYSNDGGDIGRMRMGKIFVMCKYIIQAWLVWRPGSICYYVPSPLKRSSLLRDWIVLPLIRLFYRRIIFHWHAVGLGQGYADNCIKVMRWWTRYTHGGVDMSWVLAAGNAADAGALRPKQCLVVPNGIPDPCSDFEPLLVQRRHALKLRKLSIRSESTASSVCRVLFCSTCTREKGVFDALEAVFRAAKLCPKIAWELQVAGKFIAADEAAEFRRRASTVEGVRVQVVGEVLGEAKARLFCEADCFLFPTYYPAEGQPLVVMEAMAWGLSLVTTRWRGIPEMVDASFAWLAAPGALDDLAQGLVKAVATEVFSDARNHFLSLYTYNVFHQNVERALLRLNP